MILQSIANLTAALNSQDSATQETAEARRRLIRQAVKEGHTLTAIGEASGITRVRVSQLAKEDGE